MNNQLIINREVQSVLVDVGGNKDIIRYKKSETLHHM